MNTEYHS